jgi:hypothetical protein
MSQTEELFRRKDIRVPLDTEAKAYNIYGMRLKWQSYILLLIEEDLKKKDNPRREEEEITWLETIHNECRGKKR